MNLPPLKHLNYTLRSPKAGEEQTIYQLITDVLAGYHLSYTQKLDDFDFDNLPGVYSAPRSCFFVVEDAMGKIIGCGGLKQRSTEEAEICKLYLHTDARGQGLGSRLLQSLIDFARACGYKRITLETSSKLPEALRLYERFGFQGFSHLNEQIQCDLRYKLTLSSPVEAVCAL